MKLEVVTAGDYQYKPIVDLLKKQTDKFGYDLRAFDLGGLEMGTPMDIDKSDFTKDPNDYGHWPRYYCKIIAIRESFEKSKAELIAWLDADALIISEIDLFDDDFDVAVTKRFPKEISKFANGKDWEYVGGSNAGVIFFRNNDKARKFVDMWDDAIDDCDQRGLNALVMDQVLKANLNDTFMIDDIKVRVLSSEIYNNYKYRHNKSKKTIIVHFKGMRKPEISLIRKLI
jgi:hypothetical protein